MALISGRENRLCLHCSPRGRIAGQPCNRSSQGTGGAAALDNHQRPDRLGQHARDGAGPRRARPSPPPVDAHAGIVGQTRFRVGDHLTPALIASRGHPGSFRRVQPAPTKRIPGSKIVIQSRFSRWNRLQQMSTKLLGQAEGILDAYDLHALMLGGPIFRRHDRCKEMDVATE